MSDTNFKIAIDLHGTYDQMPELFEKYLFTLPSTDIYIFSGSPKEDINNYLASRVSEITDPNIMNMMKRVQLLSIVDYCFEQGLPMEPRVSERSGRESWYFKGDEAIWWAMKGIICQKHGINLLIDDKEEYLNFINIGRNIMPKFILFKGLNGEPATKTDFIRLFSPAWSTFAGIHPALAFQTTRQFKD
jgi:hypothetical protein